MFTEKCFIRKNSKELRDKLQEIGYNICPCCLFEDAIWLNALNLPDYNGSIHGIGYSDEIMPMTVEQACAEYENDPACIDCGDNDELFLAIAALQNDNDYRQWFKIIGINGIEFVKSVEYKFSYDAAHNIWHKANVEELINHFKK